MPTFVLFSIFLILGYVYTIYSSRRRTQFPLPPGPLPLPIVGNMLHMPHEKPWIQFHEWCQTYESGFIYLDLPMQPTVVLGSFKGAMDLLEKRSHIYSNRPRFVLNELMGFGYNFGFIPYGPSWRSHRRMFHQHFDRTKVYKYRPVQLQHIREFLSWVLESPEHTRKHIRHMITSIMFVVTYGEKITDMDHEYVTSAQTAIHGQVELISPGKFWVESFPFLRHIPSWVPFTDARRLAEKYAPFVAFAKDKPYADVEKRLKHGLVPSCLATALMDDITSKYGGTDDEAHFQTIAKNVAGVTYAAGADTSVSSAETFLLLMALYPEVQAKAQRQLEQVVGSARLPSYEDIPKLPYIRAAVMESLRWMPVAPFGIPHNVIADDVYNGFHIPKGSDIVANIWAMTRDMTDYPDPELFSPERFLDDNGEIDPSIQDPAQLVFGFGRRICPGRHFAMNTLMIYAASILHVYNITPGTGADGNPVRLTTEFVGGIISNPRDIPCGLTPRSDAALQLIREGSSVASDEA